MNERKIFKKLNYTKQKHHLIKEYAENFQLIETGLSEDLNNYDFTLKDEKGNVLTLRKTIHGNSKTEVIFILKTKDERYVNAQRVFEGNNTSVRVYCIESEKLWKFTFKGEMIKTSDLEKPNKYVELTATFNSDEPIIDLFDHLDYKASAKKLLKSSPDQKLVKPEELSEQVSYIQKGMIEANIKLDEEELVIKSKATRKHNFGKLSLQSLLKYLNVA